MPSCRTSQTSVRISAFDVIGQDGQLDNFITHAGLAANAVGSARGSVDVVHMKPPLQRPGSMRADVVGSAELTADEIRKIENFIDRHTSEHQSLKSVNRTTAAQAYCIHPHMAPLRASDGRYVRQRFSCAGFVHEGYKAARIALLNIAALPPIRLEQIRDAYPVEVRLMETDASLASQLGLAGNGPWPVMLCGYLFHALKRSPVEIREAAYEPQPDDARFK